jgi:7-alpha-hydroxysteroid dehydrogenase
MTAPAKVTSGRVALVTGASSGIGEATARRLAQRGYTTYAAARRISRMDALRDQGIHTVPVDVTDDTSLVALVEQVITESGRLDVLVNNAGGTMPRAAMVTSERFLEQAFRFNVTAAFTLTKLAAQAMADTSGRGAVVNISSRSASMTQTSFVAYGAAKAALDRMTRNIAPELAPRVRVNAIDVGGVATRSLDIVLTDDNLRGMFLAGTPMGRPGEPEDIACAVLYLVSDASSWVTGKVFDVDGGTESPAITVPVPPLEPVEGREGPYRV